MYLVTYMSLAADIASCPASGPRGRTLLLVSVILFGLLAPVLLPASVAPSLVNAPLAYAPGDPAGGMPAAIDGPGKLRIVQFSAYLTVLPDPLPLSGARILLAHRLTSSMTPAQSGMILPARVQADL
jgi:hypothetical protein